MDIEAAVVDHLLSDPSVIALVGAKIFPLAIPQDQDVPAITYQRISSPRTLTLDKESDDEPRIQIVAWAKTYGEAKDIAIAVNASLDMFIGKLGDQIKAVVFRADHRDDYEPETGRYRADVDFIVQHTKKN